MIWIITILIVVFSGCQQKPQQQHYTEVVMEAPAQSAPSPSQSIGSQDPHAGLDMSSMVLPPSMDSSNSMFSWETPDGWKQEAGQGMRLASFHLISDDKAIDCSIVSLQGMAGGLEANLKRWMGQIGLKASSEDLTQLINAASIVKIKGGQEGKVFDFTTIQLQAKPSDKSMVVVMVSIGQATVFLKMTGTLDTVKKNKEGFFSLVKSFEPNHSASNNVPDTHTKSTSTINDPHAGMDISTMAQFMGQNSEPSQSVLTWETPSGWMEEPAKHMRLVSFHLINDVKAFDCYIISLGGEAGGLEPNLQRWMGQIGLETSQDSLKLLIASGQTLKTKGNLEARVFDFTALQVKSNSSDKSMIVAMMTVDGATVFIKMTGSLDSIKQNKENFLKLISSISHK